MLIQNETSEKKKRMKTEKVDKNSARVQDK